MGLGKTKGSLLIAMFGIKSPKKLIKKFAETKLEALGVRGQLSEGEVDSILLPFYDGLAELERLPTTPLRKLMLRAFRRAVVELEFLLLPERERSFSLLGVRRTDDPRTIKQNFRSLALLHHPDRNGGDSKMMRDLNRAYAHVKRLKGFD